VPVRRWGSVVPRQVGLAEQASGLLLRCTLKGFEKNHQLKILSNSMIHVRLYSTDTSKLSLKSSSGTFVSSNSDNIKPEVTYSNADTQKGLILKENRGKSGIYRWVNLVNGKTYVGSGVNLSKRIGEYYSPRYLKTKILNNKSKIYMSLIKYGYSKFALEVLEYKNIYIYIIYIIYIYIFWLAKYIINLY